MEPILLKQGIPAFLPSWQIEDGKHWCWTLKVHLWMGCSIRPQILAHICTPASCSDHCQLARQIFSSESKAKPIVAFLPGSNILAADETGVML